MPPSASCSRTIGAASSTDVRHAGHDFREWTRLLQLGYVQLRLLTDLREQRLEGDVEVQVECERAHMPFKGRVLVRNGAVRDVALQTVAPTFP